MFNKKTRQQKKLIKKAQQVLKHQLSFVSVDEPWAFKEINDCKFIALHCGRKYTVTMSRKEIEVIDIKGKDIYYFSL